MSMSKFNAVNAFMVLTVAGVGWYAYKVYPYYIDYFKMRELTQVVALDYEAFSEAHAKATMSEQLDKRNIGLYFVMENCKFFEEEKWKVVHCDWSHDVHFEIINKTQTLRFETEAAANWKGLDK